MTDVNDVTETPVAGDESQGVGAEPRAAGGEATIQQDLRAMGERLSAVFRAAAGTPEAEALKGDVREGLEQMRQELDKALQKVPTDKLPGAVQGGFQRGGDMAAGAAQRLRVDLAGWLRDANRGLEKLAASLESRTAAGGEAAAGGEDAPGGDPPQA